MLCAFFRFLLSGGEREAERKHVCQSEKTWKEKRRERSNLKSERAAQSPPFIFVQKLFTPVLPFFSFYVEKLFLSIVKFLPSKHPFHNHPETNLSPCQASAPSTKMLTMSFPR